MNRLKEIHLLKGKAQTREELLALEKEQIELELELATEPDVELNVNANASAFMKEIFQHDIDEPESLEDALIN